MGRSRRRPGAEAPRGSVFKTRAGAIGIRWPENGKRPQQTGFANRTAANRWFQENVAPPEGSWSRPPAFDDGAAGLVSTVDDLLAFAQMFLLGGAPALSGESVTEMTRDQLSPAQRAGQEAFLGERSWGLCQSVLVSGDRAGAYGWDGGLGSSFLVDPARDLVVIVLTQRLWETAQPPAVHTELQAAACAALRRPTSHR